MNKYIGFKMIQAEPMNKFAFHTLKTGETTKDFSGDREGYWIPVDERLPEKSTYDWVLAKCKMVPEGYYGVPHIAELRNGVWYADCFDTPLEETVSVKVTHWTPIPGDTDKDVNRLNSLGMGGTEVIVIPSPCDRPITENTKIEEGYKVVYPDGYESWSPKEVFEKAYMQIGDNFTIVDTNVNDFVSGIEYQQWGDKTTIANATLANGFILTESSSCVDPANFNMDIGQGICKEKIYNEVWKLLGFLLQTARYGIKR